VLGESVEDGRQMTGLRVDQEDRDEGVSVGCDDVRRTEVAGDETGDRVTDRGGRCVGQHLRGEADDGNTIVEALRLLDFEVHEQAENLAVDDVRT